MLEFTSGGSKPVALPNGEQRGFLQDGDEITFRGRCSRQGYVSIGFGSCVGQDRSADFDAAAGHPADARREMLRWSAGRAARICGIFIFAGPRPGRGAPWTAGDGFGRAVSTLITVAMLSTLLQHDRLVLPRPLGLRKSVGERSVHFLNAFAKAGRVGEADALGDLIDAHMGVLEQLGRQRSAHLVDDGLIGQSVVRQPSVQRSQGKAELGGDFRRPAGNRFGLLRQAARICRTSSDSPGRSVNTTSQTCWQILAVIGFAFGQGRSSTLASKCHSMRSASKSIGQLNIRS